MNKTPKKKQLNKYIHLTGIGFQMGATMYLAAYLGKKLDNYFQNEKKICTLLLLLLGLGVSIWNVLRQLKNINDSK
ncbi:AtpZ/AtpI family protein [Lutibacter flavus]|uniref:Putative F0F1-ATPase subunit Ca2+/Mg2+ transporter n=1 Tax=Lutibacter flavus TaxID=691689 RepID=A0A238X2R9_9FLAO|nr:AtpZ/AtpI family protein [Lutibacter flavus]SNR52868.1 Putative F0F1-ATPase subunit Ca2+/Mg2+ transporter [Lutibacter flavus]